MKATFDIPAIKTKVIEKLKSVYDPEIPVNVYDLGLIYTIAFENKENYLFCTIEMTLTSPACPVAEALLDQVQYVVQQVDEIDEAKVNLVFDPPWDMNKLTPEGKEIMILNGAAI